MAPTNHAAVVTEFGKPFEVKEVDFPPLEANTVIIKNHVAAVNPIDALVAAMGLMISNPPAVLGIDTAGVVIAVGSGVSGFKVGDRVVGMADYSTGTPMNGSFREYVDLHMPCIAKIPDSMSFEQAAVIPLGLNTAASGLYSPERLALPLPTTPETGSNKALVVTGGSSSVGAMILQLCRASGIQTITTSSKRNFDFCSEMGATAVFDYADADYVDKIVTACKGKEVVGAYDAIGTETNTKVLCKILALTGGRKFLANAQFDKEKFATDGVTVSSVQATELKGGPLGDALWKDFLPKALVSGAILCKPDPKVVGHGVEASQAAVDAWRAGVSAQKIVFTL